MLFVSLWPIGLIVNDFFATVVEEFCSSMLLKHLIVSLFRGILTRADCSGYLLLLLEANGHVFSIIAEVAMLFMSPWPVGRVVNDLFATKVEEFVFSVIFKNLLISAFVLVFSRTWSNR